MKTSRASLFALVSVLILFAGLPAAAEKGVSGGPGSNSPLVIPAAAFASDGDTPATYFMSGPYVAGGTGVHLRAPIYLPARAFITQITVTVLDNNGVSDAVFTFHETPFSVLGVDNDFLVLQTTGADANLQYLSDSAVDHASDPGNNLYWVEAYVPASDIRLYSVHVFFDDDVLFADSFESATTERWDSSVAKSARDGDRGYRGPAPRSGAFDEDAFAGPEWTGISDPEVIEALEQAVAANKRFGSPVVLPGTSFKSVGSIEWDTYRMSPLDGYLYGVTGEDSRVVAPVVLPTGATIVSLQFFFEDSNSTDDIRFRLSRLDVLSGSDLDLLDETSTGDAAGIRSLSYTNSDLVDPLILNNFFSYWLTVDLDGLDAAHKLYAVIFFYTLP